MSVAGRLQRVRLPSVTPLRCAARLAVGYLLVGSAYIVLSTTLAAGAAKTVRGVAAIELLKGLAFVVVTGVAFSVAAWVLMRRIERQARQLEAHEVALLEAERRSVAALVAMTVAHELNNTLTIAWVAIEEIGAAEPRGDPAGFDVAVSDLRRCLRDITALVQRLRAPRPEGVQPEAREPVDVAQLARDAIALLRRHRDVQGRTLVVEADEPAVLRGDAVMVEHAVLNLVLNGAQAVGPGGRVLVTVARSGDEVLIEVHDDGPGVNPDRREDIFRALHTSRAAGTGLGLLAVRAAVRTHGGRVSVDSSERLGGARFVVRLPAGDSGEAPVGAGAVSGGVGSASVST